MNNLSVIKYTDPPPPHPTVTVLMHECNRVGKDSSSVQKIVVLYSCMYVPVLSLYQSTEGY